MAVLAVFALVLTRCAPVVVSSYAERGVNFAQYRTYNWAAGESLATGDPRLDNNPFFHEQVQRSVETYLVGRGFEKTTGQPDLLLHYHASVGQRLDLNGADQKYAACDNCIPFVYDAGTLLIDFVDMRTNRLAWRGWAEGSLDGAIDNQEWMEERIDKPVTLLLGRLPHRL